MMKNNFLMILPIVFFDLLIPFILSPAYKGYNHLTQVMSVLGYMALAFAPLVVSIYGFHSSKVTFGFFSIVCFILTIIFFTFFIMADKTSYKNTIAAYEGLWQRLSLFCMYLPLGCLMFLIDRPLSKVMLR